MTSNHTSHVYVGLAGETAPGRIIKSGLYRLSSGDDRWALLGRGLPEAPAIRAIAVHPDDPAIVYVGTQQGPYRTMDHGEHWEKVHVADHGLPVWSLLFDPRDASVMYAGYENCEIYRSDDGGERWQQLPVAVRFPEVTVAPGANPAKRILGLGVNPLNSDELYGAIEVGGIIRSLDGGEHWENMSHGHYLNDDTVDMHGVLVGRWRPGTIYAIARAGLFKSTDQGEHWVSARLEPLNAKGQTYCRDIQEVPGDPKTIWVAAGPNFQSDGGVLFRSTDGGASWARVDMGLEPRTTLFALAFDRRQPSRMFCATSGGEVFSSEDSGQSWSARPLPDGASQVYAMACAS
ncbi:MAG: hypothetical protein AB7N91_21685 [Candidatus Tectimicrobiota bacterium]